MHWTLIVYFDWQVLTDAWPVVQNVTFILSRILMSFRVFGNVSEITSTKIDIGHIFNFFRSFGNCSVQDICNEN